MGVSRTAGIAVLQRGAEDGDSAGYRPGRTRALVVALALVMTAVPLMAASVASGANGNPARSTLFNQGGFPLWYEDATGVRVEPCLDPALTNCLAPLAAPGIYDPAQPLSFPTNYPDEFFYASSDAEPTPVADCAVSAGEGVTVTLALEAAFINGAPAPGDQMVFGRIRVGARAGSGLCGNTWYTFRTPYGPVTLQTPSDGQIRGGFASANTVDIGCMTPSLVTPCNFDDVFQAPVLGVGLLRQAAGAVPGYLGSSAFAPVTGGKDGFNRFEVVKWPAGTTPTAGYGVDCVDVGCAVLGSTTNFNVLSKLAGPLSADIASIDFGGQGLGSTSAPRTVTVTNLGSGPLGLDPTTIDHVTVTGPGAGQFTPATTSCSVQALTSPAAATPMARDASCGIDLTFTPSALGAVAGVLEVWPTGATAPLTVALAGTGIEATQGPIATIDPANLQVAFGDVRITNSSLRNVTVTNTGNAPLNLTPSIAAGSQSAAFGVGTNSCPTGVVNPGASCVIGVTFTPTVTGAQSAQLELATNVAATPVIGVALSANGTGGVAAVATTLVDGFPEWYQDERGVRVGQCADPANALCITAPVTGPVSFPDNYPDEAFYYLATSDDVSVADATCGATPGTLFVLAGVEAAFASATPQPGQQVTFGRIRFVGGRTGGLCPNTSYVVTFPYGQSTITTDQDGAVKPSPGTTDVGCGAGPCDFSLAIASPVFAGFLQQAGHPAGYLGNPLSPGLVTGAPFIDPDTGQPANHVTVRRLDSPGVFLGSTDLFGVSGRLAGPMVATPGALDFGGAEVGSPLTLSTTFANVGTTQVTLGALPLTITGTNAADFAVTATSCTASLPLAPGATCTADMTFTPSATGNRAAGLVLAHDGLNDPLTVPLVGIGNAPAGQPAISASPASVAFTDRHVGTVSESQTVTISNLGGSAPLVVGAPAITAGQPYQLTNNCLAAVDPDLACTITVRFAPNAEGAFPATLSVPSNAGTATVALTGKGVTAAPSLSGANSSAGFPTWIQDGNGVRLEQCLSTDGNCVLLADATFRPQDPIVFPTNYPMESFYSLVDSELVTIPAQVCAGGILTGGGTALLRIATEAGFVSPSPSAGNQDLFNRIRVLADGLCPNSTYRVIEPYGELVLTTDGTGVIKETLDIPDVTGTDPVLSGVLRWDPNVAPAAPAGYLGDAISFHTVVGSSYRPLGSDEPANYFRLVDFDGNQVVETDRFMVAARLAGPVVSNLAAKDFGTVRQGQNSNAQGFVITNVGSSPVSGFTADVTGADASLFVVTANNCTGATLATDQSCTVTVQLRVGAATPIGVKSATLTVAHDGLRSPVSIALSGTAITSAQPSLSVTPTSIAFGSVNVGVVSAGSSIVIRNSGTAPMRVGALAVGGANAGQFRLTGTSSTGACPIIGAATQDLGAGAQCTVTVAFAPTSGGAKTGSIAVTATDPATSGALTPVNVSLSGSGVQGTISLSATTLNINGRAGRTQTASVKLTNTGNAPFSLLGTPALLFTALTGIDPVSKFTATHNCNNVAPRKTCQVTVSFAPGAGPVGQSWATDLYMFSNSSNTVVDPRTNTTVNGVRIRVNGTRTR